MVGPALPYALRLIEVEEFWEGRGAEATFEDLPSTEVLIGKPLTRGKARTLEDNAQVVRGIEGLFSQR